jgi:hypothetical protein
MYMSACLRVFAFVLVVRKESIMTVVATSSSLEPLQELSSLATMADCVAILPDFSFAEQVRPGPAL